MTREPLVHFAILGALLFAAYRWLAPERSPNEIVVPRATVEALRAEHTRRTGKPPTTEEERDLIARHVDQEILYREAIALGLDRGDVIVRRRLVQKMEFVAEGLEPVPSPTEQDLQRHLDAYAERYAIPARVTFTHVFASRDRYSDAAAVSHWLKQIEAGIDPQTLGEPFLHGARIIARTERDITALFGSSFAAKVMQLPAKTWSGPIESTYGFHLVHVEKHHSARNPPLAEVADQVRRDWFEQRRSSARQRALQRLRERYSVTIE